MLRYLKELKQLLQTVEVKFSTLLLPALLAVCASFFEGLTLALLIPTIQATVNRDLKSIYEVPMLGKSFSWLFQSQQLDRVSIITMLVAATFCAAVVKIIFAYLSGLGTTYLLRKFANDLRVMLYKRYLSFGKLYFDRISSGHLHQVLTTYVSFVSTALGSIQNSLYVFCTLTIYIAMMFWISWQLTLVVLTVFPVLHLALAWLIRKIAKTSESHSKSYNDLGKKIANSLLSIALVKAYSNESNEFRRFSSLSEEVSAMEYSIEKKSLLIGPIQDTILLCFLLLLVGLIAMLGNFEQSAAMAGYVVFLLILKRAATLFGVFNSVQASLASVHGPIQEVMKVFSDDQKFFVPQGRSIYNGFTKSILFVNLNFTYAEGLSALHNVSFEIEKSKVTAVVGESGAGKSTLINLLMRFYDAEPNAIFVDGNDIREYTLSSWREKIALVSQDTLLFNDSVRANILYGLAKTISEEELRSAVARARLADFIASLPKGLETEIGDHGIKLSGGERQRVSIARALLKNPEILLLDEATSALDSRTELLVQEAIKDLTQDKTTLVVAHRLATIRHADKIIVMERGKIVEQGIFQNLINAEGPFSHYWREQRV